MKREGCLIQRIADIDNLYRAFYKSKKGKESSQSVQLFDAQLYDNIQNLQQQIISGNVDVGNYTYFKIFDPKERLICAAAFPERVLHHAIMNICHPYFERNFIYDTYATRPDKGIYKALDKVLAQMKKYRYVAKLDYRKYFDSIPHQILKDKLGRLFKDKQLRSIFSQIIDSYVVTTDENCPCGLPIGNLTSQYFANFYLSELDHFIKENLRISFYVRYMDDMLIMGNNRDELKEQLEAIKQFSSRLRLTLKPIVLNKTELGISFLGYKIYPHRILLNSTSKKRFERKLIIYEEQFQKGIWDECTYQQHLIPLLSYVQHAYTKRMRKEALERLEPCFSATSLP